MTSGGNNFNVISLQAYLVERCCIGTVPLVLISFGERCSQKNIWGTAFPRVPLDYTTGANYELLLLPLEEKGYVRTTAWTQNAHLLSNENSALLQSCCTWYWYLSCT